LVNADPYFASSLGSRPVNGDGLNGQELMRDLLCTYPEQSFQSLPTNTMWAAAVEAANQQNGGSSTTAERWEVFASYYVQQKRRVINLQKKNPCDSERYSPFLFDAATPTDPADMVADLPRDHAFNYWGNATYDLGSGTTPTSGLHPVYADWDASCGVQTSSIARVSALLDEWSYGDNEQLRVMDERAAGFAIRIPDMEQVAQDLVDDGANDGILGENDDWDELGQMINTTNPCVAGASVLIDYPTPFVAYPTTAANILLQIQRTIRYWDQTSTPADCIVINSDPSSCSNGVDGTAIYYSMEDFYWANPDFFDCMVATVNDYVSVPYDFVATHTPTHFVITSPSHGDLIPNGAIFSTYNDCTTCVGNLRNRSAGGKEMKGPRRPFDGRSDWRTPSGEETKARTRAGASPLGACYEFWNPCDQIIPHCLCEDLNGAAGLTAGGTAVEIAALYALEYGSTAAAWEPFVEELMSQCNTIIYNAFASDAAQVDAVALIEDLADGVVDLPSSPNHPAPIVLDCFTNEPPPCDEAQTIADYYNEAIGEDAIGALLEEFPFAYANTCLNSQTPPDDLSMSYVDREYHFTLYYYSAEGNLYATVPPEGVRPISGTDPTVFDQIAAIRDNGWGSVYEVPVHRRNPERDDQFMTVNHYDSYDNFTETRHPDHQGFTLANDGYRESGATEYLYDDIGQLRFFRDPQQASEGKVTYAKYDAQGREIETGEFYWPTGFNFLEQQVNDPTFPLASEHALEEITQTYYDEVSGASPGSQTNLRNRIAKQQYYEAESVLEHATYYSYDIFGNVRSLWQEDFNVISTDGFRKRLDYEYDQAFRLLEEVHYQSGQSDAYHHRYCYDANNRLTRVLTNSAGGIWEEDRRAFYRFDDLIARAELGDYKVQGSDFSYTLPGWLKGVNSATLQSERDPGNDGATSTSDPYNQLHRWMARDACGTSLYYHADDYQSIKDFSQVNHFYTDLPSQNGLSYDAFEGSPIVGLYDGNITAQQTALTGENGTLMDYVVKGYRYDQAMRLTTAKTAMEAASNSGSNTVLSANYWDEDSGSTDDYLVSLTYDRNGNINTLLRNGTTQSAPLAMDNLAYFYSNNSSGQINNRLNSITDLVPSASYDQDLDSQPSNNYTYDRIGNLTQDLSEEIASIEWTLHRRVKAVKRTAGSTRPDIEYRYDSRGNRIEKIVKPKSSTGDLLNPTHWEATHYVRGIDGKEIATYRKRYGIPRVDGLTVGSLPSVTKFQEEVYVIASGSGAPVPEDPSAVPELSFSEGGGNYFGEVIQLQETYVRAASRIGTDYHQQTVGVSLFSASIDAQTQAFVNFNYWEEYDLVELAQVRERTLGEKVYELTNHLQSVVEVVSDRLIAVSLDGLSVEHYVADIQSATDYYPFGMAMPNRSYQADPPRYGYTGQENEPEWGDQSMQNYELRMYSAAAGRFLSIDPAAATYVSLSSYAYVANNPIVYVDPTGAYIEPSDLKDWKTQTGYVKNRKAKLEKKIKDLEATAKEKNWSDKKLNRKIGNRRERIRRLEATIQTFKDMEADTKQRYNISFVTGGMGKVYYDSSTDDVVIDYTSTANFVHEITHIGQYRAGDIAFMRNSKKSYAVDLYDEVEAYKAQFAFDGVSVGALNASATSFKRITPEFVKVLKNKAGLRIYAGHGIIPIDINATKADLIKAFPNAKKLDELHESFVLKTVSNIIYFKK
ncbi:MAG: RHS repeat-associated core domain-containing protein, partial [Bacteroidota bacterium]